MPPGDVSRDVTDYEPTSHFMARLKYRTDPAPSKQIARWCIEDGEIYSTHVPERIIFEYDDGLYRWRVLAHLTDDAHNWLLTIYADGVHGDDHREVFDVPG